MNTLNMKVVGFDGESLLVRFASDETASQNPDDYPALAFQPFAMWPDVTDINEIQKRIAQAGAYHAHQQAMKEKSLTDPTLVDALHNLVGNQTQFAHDDLFPPSPAADTPLLVV